MGKRLYAVAYDIPDDTRRLLDLGQDALRIYPVAGQGEVLGVGPLPELREVQVL